MSITEKGPTIFLRLSEKTTGEYDAVFMNRMANWSGEDDPDYGWSYLNFQQVQDITSEQYNLSPRMHFNYDAYITDDFF